MTMISGGQTFQTSFTTGVGAVNAYSVEVRLQVTDLPLLHGQTASISGIQQGSTSGPLTSQASHGVSAGAAAGIGIGVALAVILAFVGAFLLFRRRCSGGVPESEENMPPPLKYVGISAPVFSAPVVNQGESEFPGN